MTGLTSRFARLSATAARAVDRAMAEPARYCVGGAGPVALQGVFHEAYAEIDVAERAAVAATRPVLFVHGPLPEGAAPGDRVEVAGRAWRVACLRPDGHGGQRLDLHRLDAPAQGPPADPGAWPV
ncbi:hypothetical protein EV659_11614 [Rhodothalassium salexigens DSM 2132]|uniref:ATP-binding sugar transporter Gifsy-2 n=1 Tax=Rhodothalassium salexigens DSM 2132 TaxID=1188247 RepID=A0A4R2P5D0_RHOSA|nr:hypothetical protein [Rhodothalassium salexigens]MBB4212759.1 hypothetical protein [Rhodothalassium salexigens DSM 2132]MBK1638963.1 hypothetical protein [Rhodothalassium salexigens DSM 2132]TCP30049.1 hypothetical protein EV659_11614 [Rhodothalassium salexigens DSM 2132]